MVEERVSVWQIFLPTPEGTTDSQISELESQSRQIADDIRAGRTDFTNAALSYSAHQPSKLNGGNMGILKVSELIPGIHEPLMALDEGEISDPVKSEMGFSHPQTWSNHTLTGRYTGAGKGANQQLTDQSNSGAITK